MKKKLYILVTTVLLTFSMTFTVFCEQSPETNEYNRLHPEIFQMSDFEAMERLNHDLHGTCWGTSPWGPGYCFFGSGGGNSSPNKSHTHSYDKEEVTTPATCNSEGKITYTCSCGNTKTEVIPMLDHEYKAKITKMPTCTQKGEMTYTCKNGCEDSYTEEVKEWGHVEDDNFIIKTEPTCTDTGLEVRVCKRCGEEIEQRVIEATGHTSYRDTHKGQYANRVDAGLFKDGYEQDICTVCNTVLYTNVLPSKWNLLTGKH